MPVPPGTRPIHPRWYFAHQRRNLQSKISREKEEAMQRLFAPAVILWLAAFGAANAQTSPTVTPTPNSTTGTSVPNSAASATGSTVANQPVAGTNLNSDPLNVPASTVPTAFPLPQATSASGGTSTGSTVGMSASPSTNPQTPKQLPGEVSNNSTQAPHTTAAAPAMSASPPCSAAVPTTAGASSETGLFGGASAGGC
jgi:hypothetical protein